MTVVVPKEKYPGEQRVALVPAHVSTLTKAGFSVLVESGAGAPSGHSDQEYTEKGAEVVADARELLSRGDVVLTVRSAAAADAAGTEMAGLIKDGATVVGHLDAYAPHESFKKLAARKATIMSMELIPRITRAQSMDALSSMANLAGYKAVILGAEALPKIFPMMMTAAGTVVPAKVFIVGVGVAGLQAIATAKRLGAVVSAYDIRPAVKEQVESLGARFVEMELDTADSEGTGGYAKAMDEEFYRKQRELMTSIVAETDLVITTAAIPGKKAPVLVTKEMVEAMPLGSVVVDLAAERGGNCEVTESGKSIVHAGTTVVGPVNLPSSMPFHASQLYSKNVVELVLHCTADGVFAPPEGDEIADAITLLRNGEPTSEAAAEQMGIKRST
jgi:H+-translocating NAD(P) transhydrogenase subunit alpha